jgi:hypothetical protein
MFKPWFEIMPSWGCMKTIFSVIIEGKIQRLWVKIYRFLTKELVMTKGGKYGQIYRGSGSWNNK